MSLYYTTMPRNTKGGNRHKKQARKSAYSDVKKAKTRLAKEEGELYAKVIKLYGGGRASILCNDGITRLLVVRNKFKGRNKRDNQLIGGCLVLAGLRLWEVVSVDRQQNADLLFVYSKSQHEELSRLGHLQHRLLPEDMLRDTDGGGFDITAEMSAHHTPDIDSTSNSKLSVAQDAFDEIEISVDDI